MEVELKLLLAPEDNGKLLQHPLLDAPARVQQLTARYFDTPDLHLMRHGAGLRVRKEDGEWMQTMKAGGSVQSGLHSRNEWECPVDRSWPRSASCASWSAMMHWLAMLDAPISRIASNRCSWSTCSATCGSRIDGNRIEVALDVGHIERKTHKVPSTKSNWN
jgi:inorganic triphosphatase YgiF